MSWRTDAEEHSGCDEPTKLCRFLSTQAASNQSTINFIHTEQTQSHGVSGLYSVHSDRHPQLDRLQEVELHVAVLQCIYTQTQNTVCH